MKTIKGKEVTVLETGEVCKVDIVERWTSGVYAPPSGRTQSWLWIHSDKPRLDIQRGSAIECEGKEFFVVFHEDNGRAIVLKELLPMVGV